ncbi:MAG: hypothetical protein AAGI22_04715 [Planctomycetota bacterium]
MKLAAPLALLASVATTAAPAPADVLVVDAGGAGSHTSVQDAVHDAAPGDIVLVRGGVYPGSVTVAALSVTIVSEDDAVIAGRLFVRDLGASDVVLLSGLIVDPPDDTFPTNGTYEGALDVRNCLGRVRAQDCRFDATGLFGDPDFTPIFYAPSGAPGVLAVDSADVALVDSRATGGDGRLAVIAPAGLGGRGVWAERVDALTLVRSVLRGGGGGESDDPGDGGDGVRIEGGTTLYLAYSASFGGAAGCWSGFMSSPGWTVDGGDGIHRGAGTLTWNFEGVLEGGPRAMDFVCNPTPAGGVDGQPLGGTGLSNPLNGFPSALEAPAVVRTGQPWQVTFFTVPANDARLFFGSGTTLAFTPALNQPRLVGGLDVLRFRGVFPTPPSGLLTLDMPIIGLPPTVDGFVQGFQGFVTDATPASAFTSPRFVVFLDSSF